MANGLHTISFVHVQSTYLTNSAALQCGGELSQQSDVDPLIC